MLLDKWQGVRTMESGGKKEWLTERSADGTYRVDFRLMAVRDHNLKLVSGVCRATFISASFVAGSLLRV
jgi:hypothetical protein